MTRRTTEQYNADIRAVLDKFWRPGDVLRMVERYNRRTKCEMCGRKVDIYRCFVLENVRTGERIVTGRKCIVKYAGVLAGMRQKAKIFFPQRFRTEADKINAQCPHIVEVMEGEDC